jgi:hypothetical protein
MGLEHGSTDSGFVSKIKGFAISRAVATHPVGFFRGMLLDEVREALDCQFAESIG